MYTFCAALDSILAEAWYQRGRILLKDDWHLANRSFRPEYLSQHEPGTTPPQRTAQPIIFFLGNTLSLKLRFRHIQWAEFANPCMRKSLISPDTRPNSRYTPRFRDTKCDRILIQNTRGSGNESNYLFWKFQICEEKIFFAKKLLGLKRKKKFVNRVVWRSIAICLKIMNWMFGKNLGHYCMLTFFDGR